MDRLGSMLKKFRESALDERSRGSLLFGLPGSDVMPDLISFNDPLFICPTPPRPAPMQMNELLTPPASTTPTAVYDPIGRVFNDITHDIIHDITSDDRSNPYTNSSLADSELNGCAYDANVGNATSTMPTELFRAPDTTNYSDGTYDNSKYRCARVGDGHSASTHIIDVSGIDRAYANIANVIVHDRNMQNDHMDDQSDNQSDDIRVIREVHRDDYSNIDDPLTKSSCANKGFVTIDELHEIVDPLVAQIKTLEQSNELTNACFRMLKNQLLGLKASEASHIKRIAALEAKHQESINTIELIELKKCIADLIAMLGKK